MLPAKAKIMWSTLLFTTNTAGPNSKQFTTVAAIGFELNSNHCALQQPLFIQHVKTEKYNNIESLKQLAIDRCTYNK